MIESIFRFWKLFKWHHTSVTLSEFCTISSCIFLFSLKYLIMFNFENYFPNSEIFGCSEETLPRWSADGTANLNNQFLYALKIGDMTS